jgi:hypothetical protein
MSLLLKYSKRPPPKVVASENPQNVIPVETGIQNLYGKLSARGLSAMGGDCASLSE